MTDFSMVRVAGPADRDEILRLFAAAHEESGLFPVNWDKVGWWVERALWPERLAQNDTAPRGVVGVIGEPDHLEGIAFIIIGTIWYSTHHHLEELVVYVEPEARSKQHVKSLIDWMKAQSMMTQLPLMAGVMSTERTEAKIRMYSREIPKAGAVFRFNPVTQGSSVSVMVH